MAEARVLWVPWPYRAGFCITDDTDAATLESVKTVYDALHDRGLKATKTVWAFEPEEPCGIPATPESTLRGVTLEDAPYRAYCKELAARGFEIALHGASAGNNRRERTIAALDMVEAQFDHQGTFICHSKNADNIYWEEKVAPSAALRGLLRIYSRHRCYGEVEGSPYFWGDVCRDRVRWIRLFRTRETNTLAADPAMPYFEVEKPFVRGWFSATKRSFFDCTTPEALDRLVAEHGATILYQYLHRYAEAGRIDNAFLAGADRLAADGRILTATASHVLARLREMQGVFVGVTRRRTTAWVFNTNRHVVKDVQVHLPGGVRVHGTRDEVVQEGAYARVRQIAAGAAVRLRFDGPVRFAGPRVHRLDDAGRARVRSGISTVWLNAGPEWPAGGVGPRACRLVGDKGFEWDPPLSVPGKSYRTRLLAGQFAIIARELALRRRSLSTERFLGAESKPLEDHGNW